MFCGELAEKSDSVDLLDCEYEGVLEMLRYMYCGEAKLNENNVMQVLYVAKKYMVNSLAEECVLSLGKKLDPSNVFCVLSHAEQYDEKVLVDQCWEMIDRKIEEAVKFEGFTTIERSLLEAVVKRDTLAIQEIKLFKAVDLWATKECERQGLASDKSAKRRILGDTIVEQIRFPVMDQKEFAEVVLDREILTQQEAFNMVKHFNSVLTSPVGFLGDRRVGPYLSCFRFSYIARRGIRMEYPREECIHFVVDKDIVLHGIRLFGSENNEYQVDLTVKKAPRIVRVNDVRRVGRFPSILLHNKNLSYHGFDIMFDPFHLCKDVEYSVIARIRGPLSCLGNGGIDRVTSNGVTVFFKRCTNSCRATTAEYGQFADFLFKLP